MKNSKNIWKHLRMPGALAVIFILASVFNQYAYADEAVCVFVSQKDNAWVMHKDSSVKQSLRVGDSLYDGDKLIVMHGNTVQLAFDKEAQNVMQIEGNTELQMSGAKPTFIDMSSGKIFAVLHKKGPESLFRVSTPTAVAAVRGTAFQVGITGQQTTIATYEGSVQVSAKDAAGKEMPGSVMVNAGNKTSVADLGSAPKPVELLSESEKHEIDPVLGRIEETKKMIRSETNAKWFEEKKEAASLTNNESKKTSQDEKGKLIL